MMLGLDQHLEVVRHKQEIKIKAYKGSKLSAQTYPPRKKIRKLCEIGHHHQEEL